MIAERPLRYLAVELHWPTKIAANKELRKETLALKANADQMRNEIALMSGKIDRGRLSVSIADQERKALDDLRDSIAYMSADPKEQKRSERNLTKEYDSMRKEHGIAVARGGVAGQAQRKTIAGKSYVYKNGKWYEE